MGHALSGERAYEKQVAEAKAKGLPVPPRTMGMEVYRARRSKAVSLCGRSGSSEMFVERLTIRCSHVIELPAEDRPVDVARLFDR